MEIIENQRFDQERALYGRSGVTVRGCAFDGPADGESAFKECDHVTAEDSFFNLRYPFWHDHGLTIRNSEMTELCRAALWYSDHISIAGSKLHGIKALRECAGVSIVDSDIISPEFGWSAKDVEMRNCTAESEYFFMRGENLAFSDVRFKGKYSFQYVKNARFHHCAFDTKDAFTDSTVKGEYLPGTPRG